MIGEIMVIQSFDSFLSINLRLDAKWNLTKFTEQSTSSARFVTMTSVHVGSLLIALLVSDLLLSEIYLKLASQFHLTELTMGPALVKGT